MYRIFDPRWLFLFIPALLAVGFMIWVFFKFAKDREMNRRRQLRSAPRPDKKSDTWD